MNFKEDLVKIVIFVPLENADAVRRAMGNAGAGVAGNYSSCSFSTRGYGRFLPMEGANPHIGEVGKLESVEEERIETVCTVSIARNVIEAVIKAHPYEEVAYDLYPLLQLKDLP